MTANARPEQTSVTPTDGQDKALPPARVGVWDMAVRVFHWTLVGLVSTSWLTGGTGDRLHEVVGYAIAGLIGFRLVWGFAGTRHARFADFVPPPRRVAQYMVDLARRRPAHHLGHNPAGALMILLLLGVLTTLVVTGTMMQTQRFFGVEWVEDVHATAANALLVIVPLHVFGALFSSWLHRENLVRAMFSGYKTGSDGHAPTSPLAQLEFRLKGRQGLLALCVLAAAGAVYGWVSTSGRSSSESDDQQERVQPAETAAQPVLAATSAEAASGSPVVHDGFAAPPETPSQPAVSPRSVAPSRREAPLLDVQSHLAPSPSWVLASGGRLYDNWYAALGQVGPTDRHPAWPEGNLRLQGADTWRCASCHGYDYLGGDGYARVGSSGEGVRGIDRMRDRPWEEIVSVLENSTHRYTDDLLPAQAKQRLAQFVSQGQHDLAQHIAADGRLNGDAAAGRNLFQSLCGACHGRTSQAGKLEGQDSDAKLGLLMDLVNKAHSHPAEVLHKVRNGHPGMPQRSLRGLDMQAAVDVLAYIRQMPIE